MRHRIGAAVSYTFNFLKNAPTTIGLFYGGRSGRPYSTTYNFWSTPTATTPTGNDLIYVPASPRRGHHGRLQAASPWPTRPPPGTF